MRFENTWNGWRKRLSDGILAMTCDSISWKVSKPGGQAKSLDNANIGKICLANGKLSDVEEIEAPIDNDVALLVALYQYKDRLGLKIRQTEILVRPFLAGIKWVTTPQKAEEDNRVELAIVTRGNLP